MPMIPDSLGGPFIRDDDEGLFSRDFKGQLVRLDAPTVADYDKQITLQIDGQPVTVPLAEPLKDANGNIIQDIEGRTTPRYTTIYDAAVRLYVKQPGDEAKIPIPTLCHQPHMKPVAVCRLCVVQIYGQKRGKRAAERKLLPACQHQVKDGMEVFTMNAPGPDGERVRQSVKVLTELLAADHLKPVATSELAKELSPFDELGQMTHRCEAKPERFKAEVFSKPSPAAPELKGRRTADASSPVFLVDHSACILCERCIRACDEVQENHVIGRTGKGSNAGISFDLNDLMGDSSCVQCGECMVSCPTSAITFKPAARVNISSHDSSAEVLSAADLMEDPVFAGVPPKFLLWQQGLVIRRRPRSGQTLCRQGDAGNTAFIIKGGKFRATVMPSTGKSDGIFSLVKKLAEKPILQIELTPANLIFGEMACLSGSERSATVSALENGEVWEVRRNVLDRLMRLPSHRQRLETEYRERTLDHALLGNDLFKDIHEEVYEKIVEFLRKRISFVRVSPGQTLFKQGDSVDHVYLIRRGYVRVGVRRFQGESKVLARGPGAILGEIGVLGFGPQDVLKTLEEADRNIKNALERCQGDILSAIPPGTRTATCSALGDLELAQLSRGDFLEMAHLFPVLRQRLVEQSLTRLRSNLEGTPLLNEYIAQGLYEGQSLLVLDTDRCTRCDECTKGCVQQHGTESHGVPVTRLLRDGLRFQNFLVATSCRSCVDAHCMVGCPVDAIHRGRHKQIVIENHCIGCGLCASNCPYGNIFLVPNEHRRIETPDPLRPGHTIRIAQEKALTCDLCDAEGKRSVPEPRCVASCPHEAAFRMTGEQLFSRVRDAITQK